MNSWTGVGAVAVGMTAQGFNVELKEFPEGWRANFYPVGIAHSIVSSIGLRGDVMGATQRASWEALTKSSELA